MKLFEVYVTFEGMNFTASSRYIIRASDKFEAVLKISMIDGKPAYYKRWAQEIDLDKGFLLAW